MDNRPDNLEVLTPQQHIALNRQKLIETRWGKRKETIPAAIVGIVTPAES